MYNNKVCSSCSLQRGDEYKKIKNVVEDDFMATERWLNGY
jgi:hypothetical protein